MAGASGLSGILNVVLLPQDVFAHGARIIARTAVQLGVTQDCASYCDEFISYFRTISDIQCSTGSHFDWLAALIYLLVRDDTGTLLVQFSFVSIALRQWPCCERISEASTSTGYASSTWTFVCCIDNVVKDELPLVYGALSRSGLSTAKVCGIAGILQHTEILIPFQLKFTASWIDESFLGIADISTVVEMLTLAMNEEIAAIPVYFCVTIFRHLQAAILESAADGLLIDLLTRRDILHMNTGGARHFHFDPDDIRRLHNTYRLVF